MLIKKSIKDARRTRTRGANLGSSSDGAEGCGECDGMGFGHIAPHNQDAVAIDEILRESSGTATTNSGTQTGYSRAVSYTGLVLD